MIRSLLAEDLELHTRKLLRRAHRMARGAAKVAWALLHRHHPLLAHVVPIRRCNLACTYCNEYDAVSRPVALPTMLGRRDHLARLGTSFVTFSGGEPLLHPELPAMVAHAR